MFASIPFYQFNSWKQIWVEWGHERARYTVLYAPTRYEESATWRDWKERVQKIFFN